jgi:hypothetical protein
MSSQTQPKRMGTFTPAGTLYSGTSEIQRTIIAPLLGL